MATTQPPPESASPALAAGLAVTVTQIYVDGEAAILAAITLNARIALRSLDPATELARRSPAVQSAVRRIMDRAEHLAARAVPKALSEAYGRGHGIEQLAAEHAVRDALGRLRTLRYGIQRWVWRLLGRLTAAMRTPNPRATADHTLQQAAGKGITGFADSRGREWALRSYVEQTVQHQAGQAAIEGFTDRLAAEGDDLVIVTESPHPCPLCDPWEHEVLSVSGADPKRPSMATAREAGLFHPRCHHTIFAWAPGFVWPPHSLSNQPGTYEATQRQRDIERHIRSWKRRQDAALDDATKAKAGVKVRAWQAELRKHLAAEGLKRSRQRERTDYGHTPSIRHAHG
jgi:hypothetical protein